MKGSLNSFFNKSKSGITTNTYSGKGGYKSARTYNFESPKKQNLKVIDQIREKKVTVQEDFDFKITESRSRDKSSKYKGKKHFNKTEPRSLSHRGRDVAPKFQRKRSVKREAKENESDSEPPAF